MIKSCDECDRAIRFVKGACGGWEAVNAKTGAAHYCRRKLDLRKLLREREKRMNSQTAGSLLGIALDRYVPKGPRM